MDPFNKNKWYMCTTAEIESWKNAQMIKDWWLYDTHTYKHTQQLLHDTQFVALGDLMLPLQPV